MSITASVVGSIRVTDNLTGSTSLSKVLNNAFTGDLFSYGQQVTISTSPSSISLPNNLAEFVYVKNLSTTAGTTVTVTWTPASGVSANIVVLDPGAMIILAEDTTSNGITSLSLVSNQAGTFVEFLLAG